MIVTTLGLDGAGFKKGMKDADDARKKAATRIRSDSTATEKAEQDAAKAREKRQKQLDEQGKVCRELRKSATNSFRSPRCSPPASASKTSWRTRSTVLRTWATCRRTCA
jgi:hypothetical protein